MHRRGFKLRDTGYTLGLFESADIIPPQALTPDHWKRLEAAVSAAGRLAHQHGQPCLRLPPRTARFTTYTSAPALATLAADIEEGLNATDPQARCDLSLIHISEPTRPY